MNDDLNLPTIISSSPPAILDTERNFLRLYLHMVGKQEAPLAFHHWSAISLLAASVMDRVYVERWDGGKMRPNLYVFLVGGSGGGKGIAMGKAMSLAHDAGLSDVYVGRLTKEALIDRLAKWRPGPDGELIPPNPNIYLMTEELGDSVRVGEHGWSFITGMTALYNANPFPWRDSTRGGGELVIEKCCPNWLAATTAEWMRHAIPPIALAGGFAARVLCIYEDRDYRIRYPQMIKPMDAHIVHQFLARRLAAYTWLEGPFRFTPEAEQRRIEWYLSLPTNPDEEDKPMLNRADEMVHRLSLIYAMADLDIVPANGPIQNRWPMTLNHLEQAIDSWTYLWKNSHKTISLTQGDKVSGHLQTVARLIQRAGTIPHSTVLRRMSSRGVNKRALQELLDTLVDQGAIEVDYREGRSGRVAIIYTWKEEEDSHEP